MTIPRLLFFVLMLPISLLAQDYSRLHVPFSDGTNNYDLALSGGLQNGTFSTIDLNQDSLLDLFIFDRAGNRHRTYINCGSAGNICYDYAPEYEEAIPPDLQDWALMRDFNGDGVEDLFTGFVGGIRVYRGQRDSDGTLSYELMTYAEDDIGFQLLQFPLGNDYDIIYVAGTDVPAIEDIDGDGDLDILSFSDSGTSIYYYKNYQKEFNLTDSLVMRLEDRCWGKFAEGGLSADLFLSPDCGVCGEEGVVGSGDGNQNKNPLHAGSTLAIMDMDGDQDYDLLLGDLSGPSLVYAENGGNTEVACMTSSSADFPDYDVPVDIQVFLAPFFIDVNNDGRRDMISTPTIPQQNVNHVWLHINQGTDGEARFQLDDRNFLVNEMLHVGFLTGSAFMDYNGDGLQDIILAGGGLKEDTGPNRGVMQLWLNVGTLTEPAYELADPDFLNVATLVEGRSDLDPAIGDIDGDGDDDIFLGNREGELYFFENTAGPDAVASYGAPVHPYPSVDAPIFVGQNSKPSLYDIDLDGDLDLIIGEGRRNQTAEGFGSLNWYENTGSPTAPIFTDEARERRLYSYASSPLEQSFNYTDPAYITTPDGPMLVLGGNDGQIDLISDITGDNLDTHTLLDTKLGGLDVGRRSTVSLADIDGDDYYEMLVGNIAGGFELFNTDIIRQAPVSTTSAPTMSTIQVQPIPTSDILLLTGCADCTMVKIFDINGQYYPIKASQKIRVDHLPGGIYFAQIFTSDSEIEIRKFIVVH